jgi:guanylate kinase
MQKPLAHLDEFKKVLASYHVSDAGKKILASTKLALFVGPSAAGRNTIIDALTKTGKYHYIVSDTTRAPRINNDIPEKNGVEYWFRTEEEILADLRAGKFLEAAIIHNQQVSGISLRELEKAKEEGRIAVNEVEIGGAETIKAAKPDAYIFFVAPPSFEVWMERMEKRGKMSEAEKKRRLKSAISEFTHALETDYYVYLINDTFEHSVERVDQVMSYNKIDTARQEQAREVIEQLLAATQAHLGV